MIYRNAALRKSAVRECCPKSLKAARAQFKTTLKEPDTGIAYVELILKYDPDTEPLVPVKTPWHHRGQAGWTKDGQAA